MADTWIPAQDGTASVWLVPGAPQLRWWDGVVEQLASVDSWWDGTSEQPVTIEGWWDGTVPQPLAST